MSRLHFETRRPTVARLCRMAWSWLLGAITVMLLVSDVGFAGTPGSDPSESESAAAEVDQNRDDQDSASSEAATSEAETSGAESSDTANASALSPRYPLRSDLSHDPFGDEFDPLGPEYRLEAERARQKYYHWGLQRDTQTFGTINVKTTPLESIDWSQRNPEFSLTDRFLRRHDCFRSDCLNPNPYGRVYAYDGSVVRIRNPNVIHNGPLSGLGSSIEQQFAPLLPHTVLMDRFPAHPTHWYLDLTALRRRIQSNAIFGHMEIQPVTYRDHRCWKISWVAHREHEGGTIAFCHSWLARDRDMLPIRQEFHTPINEQIEELLVVETDSFQRDDYSGLWYPQEVTASIGSSDEKIVSRMIFRPTDAFDQDLIYHDVPVFSDSHAKPPKTVVASHAPYPVLSSLRGPGSIAPSATQARRLKFAGTGIFGLLIVWAATSFTFSQTRLGRVIREFFRRHRTVVGVTGMLLAGGIAYLAGLPPGWSRYGLSWAFAGMFGLGWILATMLLMGDRKISIKVALFAAASAALLFAGYNLGLKRMKVRQSMIRDVRETGGQVVMGIWRLDEPGLFLPDAMGKLLGEAWTGRANQAAIDQREFTPRNVERWCLDEVQWLGIAAHDNQPFDVSSHALARIRDSKALWTLHVEGGYLDGDALQQVARFESLIDLYFDCQGKPIDERIAQIPELERVWLTHAVVNDDLFEKLSRVKTLECVTLIDPIIQTCDRPRGPFPLDWVEIQHCDLSPNQLKSLGNLPCDLMFGNCRFQIPAGDVVELAETGELTLQQCAFDDQSLNCLIESPKLKNVQIITADVSIEGIEAFSQRRPDVALTME